MLLHGDVGRLEEVGIINSTDDIVIFRDGVLYRIAVDSIPAGASNIVEVSSNYDATGFEDIIFAVNDITVTLPDPSNADKAISLRNITGSASTVTIATAAGTVEVSSLTDGQGVVLAPYNNSTWAEVS